MKSDDDPPRYKLTGSGCHDRFCLPCGQTRSRQIARNLTAAIGKTRVRFVTLTTGKTDAPLRDLLDHLYRSFRALQRRAFWRAHVKGGVAFLELKRSTRSDRWHPHLHLIVEGRYIPHPDLKHEWGIVTQGDSIVFIRGNIDTAKLTHYVCKYASKPMDPSFIRIPEWLDEAVFALKGRRLVTTWGGWRTLLLTQHDDDVGWTYAGELASYLEAAVNGDAEALRICRQINGSAAQITIPEPRPPPTPLEIQTIRENEKQLNLFDIRTLTY